LWRVWPKATIVSGIQLATIVSFSQSYPGFSCTIPSNDNRSLWIRSQQWYPGLRGNWWVGPRVSRRQLVAGVRNVQPSKWDVSAVQFRQWDPRSYQCYSVHCNCNHVQL
jgi:hypothetical protein